MRFPTIIRTSIINHGKVLHFIGENPVVTQKELSEKMGKSIRTIQRIINRLKKKNILQRVNGKRRGKWNITREI